MDENIKKFIYVYSIKLKIILKVHTILKLNINIILNKLDREREEKASDESILCLLIHFYNGKE